MDPKEARKLWEEMMQQSMIYQQLQMSANNLYVNIPTQASTQYSGPFHTSRISPTSVDAQGMYEYQEPEVDEQGTFYGYKILQAWNINSNYGCDCEECSALQSPRYPAKWINGELEADMEPSREYMSGIHCTKRPDHVELQQWQRAISNPVLVKCALSGTIVETEQGFRAQHAQIIGVLYNGHWQSYQDYKECTRPHSRPNLYTEYDKEAGDWRYTDYYYDYTGKKRIGPIDPSVI